LPTILKTQIFDTTHWQEELLNSLKQEELLNNGRQKKIENISV